VDVQFMPVTATGNNHLERALEEAETALTANRQQWAYCA